MNRVKHIFSVLSDLPRTAKGEWLKIKAEGTDDPELNFRAALYCIEENEKEEATVLLLKAAEQGHSEAQFVLGDQIDTFEKKIFWFERACEQNHSRACLRLEEIFVDEFSHNYYKDYPYFDINKAIHYFTKGAELGCIESQYKLGIMCFSGSFIEQDYNRAFNWFRRSAVNGHANAQFYLGLMYHHGLEIEKNIDTSIYWYKRAAQQGIETAINTLKNDFDINL